MDGMLQIGQKIDHEVIVAKNDIAAFQGDIVHELYSTFAMGRDAEFTCRQFLLAIMDEDEEGIGTSLHIQHRGMAFIDEKVIFHAEVIKFEKNKLLCKWKALVEDRLIGEGTTEQKLMKKAEVQKLLAARKK